MGRSRFAYYCRKITNMKVTEYLNHCRIEKAKHMLAYSPGMNILEIALNCGFESSQYFSTVFRKKIGVTPSEFREHIS